MAELTIVAITGLVGLISSIILYRLILQYPIGTKRIEEVWEAIRTGSIAYLNRQTKSIMVTAFILAIVLFLSIQSTGHILDALLTSLALIIGAFVSLASAVLSMEASTQSNARSSFAAMEGTAKALRIATYGGSVLGLSITSLSLLGIALLFLLFHSLFGLRTDVHTIERTLFSLAGFAFGASLAALFAQLGGGIYTKSADIGADLVGKIEAGIPEDDPRNPAVIADQVGDNVGDCAGRGADLFESMTAENIGGMIIGIFFYAVTGNIIFIFFPLLVRAAGIIATIAGICGSVSVKKFRSPMYPFLVGYAITVGMIITILYWLTIGFLGSFNLYLAAVTGVLLSLAILFITDMYTGSECKYVKDIAESSQTGPALTLLSGLSAGMESVGLPIIAVVIALAASFWLGANSEIVLPSEAVASFLKISVEQASYIAPLLKGIYGTVVATMGMLSVGGMVLTLDGVGPIVDNASGIAEMSDLPKIGRERLEPLDALGNTTKAITKGYAMASAALASLLLFQAFVQEAFIRFPERFPNIFTFFNNLKLVDPRIIIGLFIGGAIPFLFSSRAIKAVAKTSFTMVEEVRRQFREKPGILEGREKPDYYHCVDISTKFSLKRMMTPGAIVVIAPLIVGFLLGPESIAALVIGATATAVPLAILMMWGGASLDNAKKYVEAGHFGGKRSPAHAAAVIGDTVGDPLKDTAGPSLHIVIKLLNTLSIVFLPLFIGLITLG